MPAALSVVAPPAAVRSGSVWPKTTRATPASISACGARAGVAGVVARLERDDRGRAAGGVAGLGQRIDLGVRRPGAAVHADGELLPSGREQDAADRGLGSVRARCRRRRARDASR